jgi:uncharacterized protein (DUF2345 family)
MKPKLRSIRQGTAMVPRRRSAVTGIAQIPLRGQHRLMVERHQGYDAVELISSDGVVRIRIAVDNAGAQIAIEAGSIALRAAGDLEIDAQRVKVHGRQGLSLTTGGGAQIDVDASVRIAGQQIHLNA